MRIDPNLCDGHQECVPICPVNAIYIGEERGGKGKKAYIDLDRCVECYACLRSNVCPTKAIKVTSLEWPREIRHSFSAVKTLHKSTNVPGRGTEEMKTNDVTNRFNIGEIGVSIEVGRPGVGTRLENIELFTTKLSKIGVIYEEKSPVTAIIIDEEGHINEAVQDQSVLSAIIEFKIPDEKLSQALEVIREVEKEIDTVFSVGIISRINRNNAKEIVKRMSQLGFEVRPNAKVNIGLGKP